jgi:hypothetical protein
MDLQTVQGKKQGPEQEVQEMRIRFAQAEKKGGQGQEVKRLERC